MPTNPADIRSDCVVVGASFAGLACATALATNGMQVIVMERKGDSGEKLHTTGISDDSPA
jgi:flavin-dependent dehydrogenase